MNNMFYNCEGLTSLDISNFDTSSVTSKGAMFYLVPTTVKIKTNSSMKTWLNENFPSYTNIVV